MFFHYNGLYMNDIEEIFPLIFGIIVAIALFMGVVSAIKKSFRERPKEATIDSQLMLREQKRHMEDIQDRHKQLMRDQEQRIRDMQRR